MKEFEKDKYVVIPKDRIKNDGTVDLNKDAQYFVLRIDTDQIARKALKTYITELYKVGEFILANQLADWLNTFRDSNFFEKPLIMKGRCPVCTGEHHSQQTKMGKIAGVERVIESFFVCDTCGVMSKFIP
jgi:hypothetical protein